MKFDEINFFDEFDGIWACASLLHVPRSEIGSILKSCSKLEQLFLMLQKIKKLMEKNKILTISEK